ncbi:HemK/PrmC family methyltransferase [Sulfurivirga sp.]|uniref:N5-glutamine methyltransferase family protein n=1 Tax=Sulfurivirga sp. TaxID=2614236 RepID=UPI0025DF7FC3|nr:HemK/PrmC family methyltransferase [Sulfurivirga sp.]
MKICDALAHGARRLRGHAPHPEVTVRALLTHVLERPESWLWAHDDAPLPEEAQARFDTLLSRHVEGEPLAYLLGWQPFRQLTLRVTPDVLIPRPETEFLVDLVLEKGDALAQTRTAAGAAKADPAKTGETPSDRPENAPEPAFSRHAAGRLKNDPAKMGETPFQTSPNGHDTGIFRHVTGGLETDPAKSGETPLRVADLGTGSGAIALAIKAERPHWRVTATDLSEAALQVARHNAREHGLEIDFRHGRWFEPLAGERFHLIVSNPPYVDPADPHLAGGIRFEPRGALVADDHGLADLFHLIDHAPDFLAPGGWLLLEHGYNQADAVCRRLRQRGFGGVAWHTDPFGNPRVSLGQWNP